MMNKIKNLILISFTFSILFISNTFAAKYTIASGKDFNTRIKMHLNKDFTSATPEYTITGFKYSSSLGSNPIDISEDGDSSVLAYIKNNIIYCVSEEDVYLNEDSSYMFDKFINLKQVDFSFLDTSKTRNTKFMFGNCKYLKEIDFDNDMTFNLNELEGMFFDCQSIVDLNIFMFNTKNVRSMNSLFFNCKNLKNINIDTNNWSVKNVTNFNKMYFNCAMLKTNFNKPATSIEESQYKLYSIAGDDETEGLLKDYDYEYDDYGKNSGSFKVDAINETLVTTPDNKNVIGNILPADVLKSYEKSEVNISTLSELYEYHSDSRIGKNGKLKLTDWLISQTLDDVPILKEETTFIDKLVPQKKNKSTQSQSKIIIEEERESSTVEVNGILRPTFGTSDIAYEDESESIEVDKAKIDKNEQTNTLLISIILIAAIFIVTIGVFAFCFKNKQSSDEPWS